jgi:hypothetical protein
MEHNDIRHKLSDYLDGSLSAEEKTEIEAHLKTCPLCSDALRELQKTVKHIRSVEEADPPAWITQKIMARVRTESEQRKGFFSRLFLPLSVKLPIEAVALVFLAVAAFSIYQYLPSTKSSKTPFQEFEARKAGPQAGIGTDEIGKELGSAPAPRQVPLSPGYKALDMKQEYEKPALPTLRKGAGTPAQAKQEERNLLAGKEAPVEKRTAAPQPAAPVMQQEREEALLQREQERTSAATSRRVMHAASAQKAGPFIILVQDVGAAGREVEQAVTKLGGSITGRESSQAKKTYMVALDAQKIPELEKVLRLTGEMKDTGPGPAPQAGRIVITIELVKKSAHP